MQNQFLFFLFVIIGGMGCGTPSASEAGDILDYQEYAHYIRQFNEQDEELYIQYIPNEKADSFLQENIPLIDLPDKQLEKIYYFRWWTYRKHLKSTPEGFVVTEFLPDVPWAGKYNTISCPAAHHLYEGRWLRDPIYLKDYIHFWLTASGEGIRSYSFWIADGIHAFSQVYPDKDFISDHLPPLLANYKAWESERKDAPEKMFWQIDNRDGMEFSASGRILNGGESIGSMAAIRPTINSYMYGDAKAISNLSSYIGQLEPSESFSTQAATIKEQVQNRLWNDSLSFFTVMPRDYGPETKPLDIRELIGYVPWYFNLPDDKPAYAKAWQYLMDTTAFYAPYGLTVCEQSHPYFEISYEGHECLWNGPSWPFATTQALKALANFTNNYDQQGVNGKEDFYTLLRQYANSHSRTLDNGQKVPWIDENLNPFTGDWISRTRLKTMENGTWSDKKGGKERGKDYNHSAFCDLVISDLIGLKPQLDGSLEIQPLVPESWDWYCLDKVNYHGKPLTIVWDKDGSRYGKGKGYRVFYNHQLVAESESIKPLSVNL